MERPERVDECVRWIPACAGMTVSSGGTMSNMQRVNAEKNVDKGRAKKAFFWVISAFAWVLGYALAKHFPSIALQHAVVAVVWFLGYLCCVNLQWVRGLNQNRLPKKILLLSYLGFLGILFPIIGFIFAAPAFLLASYVLSKESPSYNKALWLSSVSNAVCILNANWGAYLATS